jgi:adenine-specific DNA-methyltransferase
MDGTSLTPEQEKINALQQVLPEAFSEGKIDWEKLKATLGDNINFSNERYVLNWAGKSDAFKVLQMPTTKTLVPAKAESVNFDDTENIFIEGENLEVLKVLQKSYFGKVKMIYIDPPYNTGNDSFIYPDKFSESKADYEKRVGDKDEEGYMTKDGMFKKNSKENGQYHSNWLNMMMPRLYLAKNLLRQDGVIFVHIDNNEVHNLRMLLNEIFGEENFIECINWNKRVPKNDKGIGSIHEYVLIYVKDSSLKHEFLMAKEGLQEIEDLLSKIKKKKMPLNEGEDLIRKLYNKRGYDRGITLYNSLNSEYRLWGKINMSWPNANTFGPRSLVGI